MRSDLLSPDLFPHHTSIAVRFSDLDALNHVNNAVFNTYFEEGRIRFTAEIPSLKLQYSKGFSFVLVKITVEYKGQITFPGEVLVCSALKEIGNTSITGIQAIFNPKTKKLLAISESKGVWFDLKQQKPARVPDIENLQSYLIKK